MFFPKAMKLGGIVCLPFIRYGHYFEMHLNQTRPKRIPQTLWKRYVRLGSEVKVMNMVYVLISLVTSCVALASAADVSCLEISSRTAISRQTWSIITKVHTSLSSWFVAFLNPGRTATVSTTDLRHVGEWSIRGRLYIFVTYFTM
jgi:hypothetical protein